MLNLLVFLDTYFTDRDPPDGWDDTEVRWGLGLLLFLLLFSAFGVYVLSHLLRIG